MGRHRRRMNKIFLIHTPREGRFYFIFHLWSETLANKVLNFCILHKSWQFAKSFQNVVILFAPLANF